MSDATLLDERQATTSEKPILLTDEEMITFISKGYLLLEPEFPPGFDAAIYDGMTDLLARRGNPGSAILDALPKLHEVWSHPRVNGALISLLGADYRMNHHRRCHVNRPGSPGQAWHQDDNNQRHHQIRTVLAFYYPQAVTPDMGPTAVLPGTHFRNAPTDLMASYGNLRDQLLLTVKTGTVALVHYDIWHAGTRNVSSIIRYAFKFLFDRVSEPTAPSWNHEPERATETLRRLINMPAAASSNSDGFIEALLRHEMWSHLRGVDATGADKTADINP